MNGRWNGWRTSRAMVVGLTVAAVALSVLALGGAFGRGGFAGATGSATGGAAAPASGRTLPPLPTPRPLPTTRPLAPTQALPTIDPFTPFPVLDPTYPPAQPWRIGPVTFELPEGWGIPNPISLALIAYFSSIQDPDAGIYHMALPGGKTPSDLSRYRFRENLNGRQATAGLHGQVFTGHGSNAGAVADELTSTLRDAGNTVKRSTTRLPIGTAVRMEWDQSYGGTVIHYTRVVVGAGDAVVTMDLGTLGSTTAGMLDIFEAIVRSAHV